MDGIVVDKQTRAALNNATNEIDMLRPRPCQPDANPAADLHPSPLTFSTSCLRLHSSCVCGVLHINSVLSFYRLRKISFQCLRQLLANPHTSS